MNLDQIETKCFILALFIRDDNERFLLGSRAYEFIDSQLHFVANTYQNDVVEVQGNDGLMLAGQVRRGTAQPFDGYIGDSSVDRTTIEQYRRDFLKFFRKNHYYKVVYVFPDGSAIQRRNGFIVEAPEVKELYQLFPQYHISMNFEDINYYNYEEDGEGEEIYGESATLKIASEATGGLIWENGSQTTLSGEGSNFTLNGTVDGNPISNVQLNGDTTQQTYTGKNLFNGQVEQGTFDSNGQKTASTTKYRNVNPISVSASTQYTFSATGITAWDLFMYDSNNNYLGYGYSGTGTYTFDANVAYVNFAINAVNGSAPTNIQLELGGSKTSFEPYVGGIPAPNPDYPQTVNTVTGRQVVEVYDKNLFNVNNPLQNIYLTGTGTWAVDSGGGYIYNNSEISVTPSSQIAISFASKVGSPNIRLGEFDSTGSFISRTVINTAQVVTLGSTTTKIVLSIDQLPSSYFNNLQIEFGSTATPYQAHQSYEVNLGKNLFDNARPQLYFDNTNNWYSEPTASSTSNIPASAGDKFTISCASSSDGLVIASFDSTGTCIDRQAAGGTSLTATCPASTAYIIASNNKYNAVAWTQLEKGNQATAYAPYFTPIELCKIGTYQDYIYESSGNWYVHKAIGKVQYDGTEAWQFSSSYHRATLEREDADILFLAYATLISNYFINGNTETTDGTCTVGRNSLQIRCYYDTFTSLSDYTTWLSIYKPIIYGALTTPTDTQITNADLIAQLEALASATTYNDKTVFTVSSPNQLAILSLETTVINGGGVVWDNYGAEWEEGTGGGPTTIDIESIDNVYPVWTVVGPATNPQISVLDTNTILSYTGNITASQELKIDMFNKTATLNGASVIGNVSGDWVYLKPGLNRVTYTTNNADAPDSTIWWQEIVG